MKTGFTSSHLGEYVELHLDANPEVHCTELIQQLPPVQPPTPPVSS